MAAFTKFQPFVENLAEKVFNLGADTLKVALTNTAPTNTFNQLSSVTQIANGNGYTTGGTATTITSSAQTSGTYKLVITDVVFTASGAMGTFRYAVLYDSTATNSELIGSWDYGSAVSMNSGDTFTVDFDGTNGVLTIA